MESDNFNLGGAQLNIQIPQGELVMASMESFIYPLPMGRLSHKVGQFNKTVANNENRVSLIRCWEVK